MKKIIIYLIPCLIMLACNSGRQGNAPADSTKSIVTTPANSGPFDLARLNLKENLPAVMAAQDIKPEPKASTDETLMGLEIFRSSNPKVLRFEGRDLSGSTGKNKNYALFHYDEGSKKLAFYELEIYNQEQTDTLINQLGRTGTLIFKRTPLPDGAIEIDENGEPVKAGTRERKTFRVWQNKSAGLTYFLIETGAGQHLVTKLIVLNEAEQAGKDWVSFRMLDWYKNAKSD